MKQLDGTFFRSALTLIGGTAAAQVITVAALPILTRIYTPSDFEKLAVYLSILGILASIACLRFEIAIPIPETDAEASDLLILSIASATAVAGLSAGLLQIFHTRVLEATDAVTASLLHWLVPIGTLLAGIYSSLLYWTNRKGRFGAVARSRIAQGILGVGTQIGLGAYGLTSIGLMLGHMLFGGAGSLGLAIKTFNNDLATFPRSSLRRIYSTALKYKRFPLYSTFEALSNSAAIQLPVLLIAAYAIGPEAGFVMLASRVMGAPMQLIGSSISQIYLTKAPEQLRKGNLKAFTLSVSKPLIAYGLPSFLVVAIIAPSLFSTIFGAEWQRAGDLLRWMTPWFFFQFISAPVSTSLHILNKQRVALLLQILGLLLRSGAVIFSPIALISESYALSGAIFYAIYLAVIWSQISKASNNTMQSRE